MKSYLSFIIFAACIAFPFSDVSAADEQECIEECPPGFEMIPGLPHCYKLMLEMGPASQDKAMTACGYEGGATVVTFDAAGDDQIVRDFMWNKYREDMEADPAYFDQQGYWTGYVRFYGPCEEPEDGPPNKCIEFPYVNVYSGTPMPISYLLSEKPDNYVLGEYGQEDCISRRNFWKDTLDDGQIGLDDFTCGFPHWAICMHRDVFGLNKKAYNTALMKNNVTLPASGMCQLDWYNQNGYQLDMMTDKRPSDADRNNGAKPHIRFPSEEKSFCELLDVPEQLY